MPKKGFGKKTGHVLVCPYCKKRLYVAYVKPKAVYCPKCKKWLEGGKDLKLW